MIWQHFFEELDNFITGTKSGSANVAAYCCLAALNILGKRGPVSLGINISGEVLALTSLSKQERNRLHIVRSRFLRISGRMDEARRERVEDLFILSEDKSVKLIDARRD